MVKTVITYCLNGSKCFKVLNLNDYEWLEKI